MKYVRGSTAASSLRRIACFHTLIQPYVRFSTHNPTQGPLISTRNIALLGSTGSIGRSSLDVIAAFPERLRVTYLTAHKNIPLLCEQIQRFEPCGVVVADAASASLLRPMINGSVEVLVGVEGLVEIVQRKDVDVVLNALVGFAGLRPTIAAMEAGKDIALANKETLVVAGELVTRTAKKHGVSLLPIDSEHSAILQCLRGEDASAIRRIILTASGGPFLNLQQEHLETVTVAQALNHPTWNMGNKITIDSATMMNKGLEVMEAHWLFDLPPAGIDVVIHPQSIIHSMVEFEDGSIKAQMGIPDMRLPIQYALLYPDRPASSVRRMDFSASSELTFHPPDLDRFRCLPLAYMALNTGGTAPVVLNAANEIAVQMFLDGKTPFTAIPAFIEEALLTHSSISSPTLEDIIRVDRDTRARVGHQLASTHLS